MFLQKVMICQQIICLSHLSVMEMLRIKTELCVIKNLMFELYGVHILIKHA